MSFRWGKERAQSEVIGVILLVAVVVLAVSTYGVFYLSTIDDGSQQPRLTIHDSVNPPNVTLTHAGGETVGEGELLAVVSVNGERRGTVRNDAVFEPGTSFSVNASQYNSTPGDTVSIAVYHPSSGRKLFTDSWMVDEDWTFEPPVAGFDYTPESPSVEDNIEFSAGSSFDPDGGIESYAWEFGDGESASGKSVSHSYDDATTYEVTLTVTDEKGFNDTVTREVNVTSATEPASVTVRAPDGGEQFRGGQNVTIHWNASGVARVGIEYYDGSAWNTVSNDTDNDGEYRWEVPRVSTTGAKVRVSANSAVNDTSNGTFTITRSGLTKLSVSDLVSGETGQEQTVSFTVVGDMPEGTSVTIDLSDAQAGKGQGQVTKVNYNGATAAGNSSVEFTKQKNDEAVITFTAGNNLTSGKTVSFTITGIEAADDYSAQHTVPFVRSDAPENETTTFTVKLSGKRLLSGKYDGDVYVDGDATILDGGIVDGNLTSGGEVQVNENGTITGSVTSENGVDLNGGGSIGGGVETDGALTSAGPITGNVTAADDVRLQEGGDVTGDITTDGELQVNEDGAVSGSVVSNGDIDVNEGGSIGGDARTNGSVTTAGPIGGNVTAIRDVTLQEGGNVSGNVTTDGDVQINEGGTVQGNVTAGGELDINDGGTIEGDVYVDSADDILCVEGAEIGGQPCDEYVNENY